MADIDQPRPCLALMAVFSRHEEALDWGRRQAERAWGPITIESPRLQFDYTRYYEATMGAGLEKVLWAFERLVDPGRLAERKRQSIQWEAEYRDASQHVEQRPLNLDPGYLTEAKLVLATTKDRDHRIYLGDGIFAEVTLFYRQGVWRSHPWTYPDYQSPEYHEFFSRCREKLRSSLKSR